MVDIDEEIVRHRREIARLKKEKEREILKFEQSTLILCPKCDNNEWTVRATYNPFNMLAFEQRELYLVCLNCSNRTKVKVVESQ